MARGQAGEHIKQATTRNLDEAAGIFHGERLGIVDVLVQVHHMADDIVDRREELTAVTQEQHKEQGVEQGLDAETQQHGDQRWISIQLLSATLVKAVKVSRPSKKQRKLPLRRFSRSSRNCCRSLPNKKVSSLTMLFMLAISLPASGWAMIECRPSSRRK